MKKKHILLLLVVLLLALAIPASATQYNPPWAHNYGFLYTNPPFSDTLDTRSYATTAANYQSIVGYNSFNCHDCGAYCPFTNIKDDALFFFSGHGACYNLSDCGGFLVFFNGTKSYIIAEQKGYSIPNFDQYYLSSTSTELNDILIAIYAACYSGRTSNYFGNLVDMSYQKGADNVIGFSSLIYYPPAGTWSDRFWYRCLYGQMGNPQSFKNAASGAIGDAVMEHGGLYGLQYAYSKFSFPYEYLNPARYGVV